jgi:hypothetical protein
VLSPTKVWREDQEIKDKETRSREIKYFWMREIGRLNESIVFCLKKNESIVLDL